jgi:hypothetical protein
MGGGARAFCCDNPATYNDFQLTEFKNKLNAFENPLSCPSSQTNAKRNLEAVEAIANRHVKEERSVRAKNEAKLDNASLALQQRDFKKAGGYRFIESLLLSLKATTYVSNLYRQAYEETIGSHNNFHIIDLISYIENTDQEGFDGLQSLTSALCQGTRARSTLADLRSNSADLCVVRNPELKRIKRDLTNSEKLDSIPRNASQFAGIDKRLFDPGNGQYADPTIDFPRPFTGSFMRAIANRDPSIRFLYARRIDFNYLFRGRTIPQVIIEGMSIHGTTHSAPHKAATFSFSFC